jgi:nucleotide-binding universal stress UspA family protein
MNATAIRSWWSAGLKGAHALFAPGPASRKADSSETARHTNPSQSTFWSDFSRKHDEAISLEQPGRAVKPLNILVPTDFAPASLLALDCALRMAARQPARVTLLHAIHLNLRPYGPANVDRIKTELCREALAQAQPILVSAHELGVTAFCMLEEGPPASVIARAAQRCAPDLVIMANSRRGFFARLFSRGTVKKVVQSLRCPVLVLPLVDDPEFKIATRSKH